MGTCAHRGTHMNTYTQKSTETPQVLHHTRRSQRSATVEQTERKCHRRQHPSLTVCEATVSETRVEERNNLDLCDNQNRPWGKIRKCKSSIVTKNRDWGFRLRETDKKYTWEPRGRLSVCLPAVLRPLAEEEMDTSTTPGEWLWSWLDAPPKAKLST